MRLRSLVVALAATTMSACGNKQVTFNPCDFMIGRIDVLVDPPAASMPPYLNEWVLGVGDTVTLRVVARKVVDASGGVETSCQVSHGDPIPTALQWVSSDTAVATVSDEGLVTAVAAGNDTISVRLVSLNQSVDLPFVVTP